MKRKLTPYFVVIIIISIVFYFINEYAFDILGTGFGGIYQCEYKEISKVSLKKYYSPLEIYTKARSLNISSHLNSGFGEPDNEGSGVYFEKNIDNIKYRIVLHRFKKTGWKEIQIGHVIMENACLVPNKKLVNDIDRIFKELDIERDWIKSTLIKRQNTIPWFELPLL